MRIGFHVSIAGRIYESVDRAKETGSSAMQIFSRSPRGWQTIALDKDDVVEFKKSRIKENITPLLVHIPYIINLASPEEGLYKKSISAYIEDIKRADILGAEFFVTHLGSHVGHGEEEGIRRFKDAINIVIEKTNPKTTILLETTAGSGYSLGSRFEHIAEIMAGVKRSEKIGVCLDTQHVYAAGYDIVNDLDGVVREFDRIAGLHNLKAIHLNDSKSPLGSRVDRHEHIGKGKIGLGAFMALLNHPKLKELPFIMETPRESIKDEISNMKTVEQLCKKKMAK